MLFQRVSSRWMIVDENEIHIIDANMRQFTFLRFYAYEFFSRGIFDDVISDATAIWQPVILNGDDYKLKLDEICVCMSAFFSHSILSFLSLAFIMNIVANQINAK